MRCTNHAIAFVTGHRQSILGHFQLLRTIVQCQQHRIRCQRTIQPSWNRFAGPISTFVELLTKWCMRIWLSQYVSITILVVRMFHWITMSRQFHTGCDVRTRSAFLSGWSIVAAWQFALVISSFCQVSCETNKYWFYYTLNISQLCTRDDITNWPLLFIWLVATFKTPKNQLHQSERLMLPTFFHNVRRRKQKNPIKMFSRCFACQI